MFKLQLYLDDECTRPGWFIHPIHSYDVDVVTLPIMRKDEVPPQIDLWPINKYEFGVNIPPQAGDDIFILGYPYNITGGGELPIWKRGSIATEPFVNLDGLPKMLVDTASRSGMSGSPAIMSRTGFIQNGDTINLNSFFGTVRRFVGVYSGRITGDDNRDAQLGVVWKEHVIREILEAKIPGSIEFQNK
jgi:hypothetical protein